MKHESFNESTEMYLKTISELMEGTDPVPISALAESLGVSTVSATEMIHRLKDQALLDHQPYKGVCLTAEGQRRAQLIIRRHQLWERFLCDHLKLPWEQVHDFACRLEHATDDAVADALADFLGHPRTCPHGNPIPAADGETPTVSWQRMSEMEPGARATIARIHPESRLLLDYLATRQIRPGQTITFQEVAPFNGPMMVTIDGETHALGQEIAAHIFVAAEEEETDE